MEDMECTMNVFKLEDKNHTDSTPLLSTPSSIPATILPEPTYTPQTPDPKRKPHAKKQPTGHIPRPRNAFILFRCDFVRQKKIPAQVEKDHRNISRIVGQIWRQMSDKQREPWVTMADGEKMAHSKLYPTFRFSTGLSNKKSKRGDDIPHETQKPGEWDDLDLLDLYRSSSCPPGSLHVPQANLESSNGYGAPLKTRDDMARRPSRVTLYQSIPSSLISQEGFTDINNQHYVAEFTTEDYSKAVANQDYYTKGEEPKATFDEDIPKGNLEAKFCEPRINIHPYPTPGPNDPPEWDMVPTQPSTWTDWRNFQFDQCSVSNQIFGTDTSIPFFTDPFLSTLPPLPNSYDSDDTLSPVGSYVLPPTASETESPSTYPSLDWYRLPEVPPDYIQNTAYHSNTSNSSPLQNSVHGYHGTRARRQASFFDGQGPARFQRELGDESNTNTGGFSH